MGLWNYLFEKIIKEIKKYSDAGDISKISFDKWFYFKTCGKNIHPKHTSNSRLGGLFFFMLIYRDNNQKTSIKVYLIIG